MLSLYQRYDLRVFYLFPQELYNQSIDFRLIVKDRYLFFFAAIADKQLFVSPKINIASGEIFSKIGSIFIIISPIVKLGLPLAASR